MYSESEFNKPDYDRQHLLPPDHPGITCETIEDCTYQVNGRDKTADMNIRTFTNVTEFLDYIQREWPKDAYLDHESTLENRGSFHHHENLDEAMDCATSGWDKGREQVLDVLDDIEIGDADFSDEKMEVHHDVYGERINMGAYMGGDPQCYTRREFTEDKRTSGHAGVTLNIGICYSSAVSKDAITARGAVAAALAEALEHYGIAVEINAVASFGGSQGEAVSYEIPIKKGEDPLNPDTLAFQLANPDMLRRLVFGAIERDHDSIQRSLGCAYGKVADLDRHQGENTIYLAGGHVRKTDWESASERTEWIRKELEDQGIKLNE